MPTDPEAHTPKPQSGALQDRNAVETFVSRFVGEEARTVADVLWRFNLPMARQTPDASNALRGAE
jgi:hypothetical protein